LGNKLGGDFEKIDQLLGGYYDTPLCGHLVIWSKWLETLIRQAQFLTTKFGFFWSWSKK